MAQFNPERQEPLLTPAPLTPEKIAQDKKEISAAPALALLNTAKAIKQYCNDVLSSRDRPQDHLKLAKQVAHLEKAFSLTWFERNIERFFSSHTHARFVVLTAVNQLKRDLNVKLLSRTEEGRTVLWSMGYTHTSSQVKELNKLINKQDVKGLRELLGKHPSLANANINRQTALQIGVSSDNSQIVQALLDSGADPNAGVEWTPPNQSETAFSAPLFIALRTGKHEIAKILANEGADPMMIENKHMPPKHTAFYIALTNDAPTEVLKTLAGHARSEFPEQWEAVIQEIVKREDGPEIIEALGLKQFTQDFINIAALHGSKITIDYLKDAGVKFDVEGCLKLADNKKLWEELEKFNKNSEIPPFFKYVASIVERESNAVQEEVKSTLQRGIEIEWDYVF